MISENFTITSIKRIIYVSKDEYKEKTTKFNMKSLSSNELIFHINGSAYVYFNEKELFTKKDTLRFLPEGDVKKYIVNRESAGDCIDIFFNTNLPISSESFVLDFSNNASMQNLFRRAFSIWSAKRDGYYFECMALIYEILAQIYKNRYNPKSKQAIISPAVKYISENYAAENISIPYLASLCLISESYLKKTFLNCYGLTPKKYITKLRTEYAAELLSSELFSVSKVAEMTGYNNVYYFSKAFKNETGISPIEYKNKCKSSK